jgi:hypothetical protein
LRTLFVQRAPLVLRKRRSTTLGFDGVVPLAVERVAGQVDGCQLGVGNVDPALTASPDGLFDAVLARDGAGMPRADLSLGTASEAAPVVVGVILAHPQPEYADRQRRGLTEQLVRELVRRAALAPLSLDTRLEAVDELGCRTPEQFRALVARVDVVVTTRLHGLVLALDAGVPALVLHPVAGGAKVTRQAEVLGWPAVCGTCAADAERLDELLRWCLTTRRADGHHCARHGRDAWP